MQFFSLAYKSDGPIRLRKIPTRCTIYKNTSRMLRHILENWKHLQISGGGISLPRVAYISSDDTTVLYEARRRLGVNYRTKLSGQFDVFKMIILIMA